MVALWREVDTLGFDSAWVFDNFLPIFSDPTKGSGHDGKKSRPRGDRVGIGGPAQRAFPVAARRFTC
jgi:hypothetical protein